MKRPIPFDSLEAQFLKEAKQEESIKFETDKNYKKIDYEDVNYDVYEDDKEKEVKRKKEESKKKEYKYNQYFDLDFKFQMDKKKETERSEFNPEEIPIGNSETTTTRVITTTIQEVSDGDEEGKTENDFEEEKFISEKDK